jgi:glycosyltransferase involved in cell wall biosynthesis
MGCDPARLSLVAMTPWGWLGRLSPSPAASFIEALAAAWRGERARHRLRTSVLRLRSELLLSVESSLETRIQRRGGRPVYLLVSHQHLDRPQLFARLKERSGARMICLVHDIVPIAYPEFSRPGQHERHMSRMTTVAEQCAGVIVNSESTRNDVIRFLVRARRSPPLVVGHLGVDLPLLRASDATGQQPYFVALGTIEPRKNHILLLNIWRELIREQTAPPRLIVIGQRGWENEAFADAMERSTVLKGVVVEFNALDDAGAAQILAGSRALLMPSFAEGFGLPVAEALAAGVPVIASDLSSLREVAGEVPDYLSPLDGLGWKAAIKDYAQIDSHARAAQIARMSGWRAPTWDEHFAIVEKLIEEVSGGV